jgi:hypothetical protein
MPRKVTCRCGTVNRVREDEDLSQTRCEECGARLAGSNGEEAPRKEKKAGGGGKKDVEECFLCERVGKGKRFSFYSGIMKGGTTHRMLSCTVTFFERWSDLTMHEMHVCRECQVRLWQQQHKGAVIGYGVGTGVAALLTVVPVILLSGAALWVTLALGVVVALALGTLFFVQLKKYRIRKPRHADIEPLVIDEAMDRLPCDKHTFMTTEQYLDRVQKGIIG